MVQNPRMPTTLAEKRVDFQAPGLPCTLPVTVHIGYPRTASTFLTKAVYQAHPRIMTNNWFWQLVDRAESGGGTENLRDIMLDIRLSGWVERDRTDIAAPLAEALPNARILCFVRDQRSMFRAQYFLYLKSGGMRTLRSFVRSRLDKLLHYDRLYEAYADAFGSDRLLFLTYEEFQREPANTTDKVLRWIGVNPDELPPPPSERVKPSGSNATNAGLLIRNWIFKPVAAALPENARSALYRQGLIGARVVNRLPIATGMVSGDAALDREIEQAYADGNDRFFAKIGLTPGACGYPTAERSGSARSGATA